MKFSIRHPIGFPDKIVMQLLQQFKARMTPVLTINTMIISLAFLEQTTSVRDKFTMQKTKTAIR